MKKQGKYKENLKISTVETSTITAERNEELRWLEISNYEPGRQSHQKIFHSERLA